MTPLIALDRIARELWIKDEGCGPTGSWLDRFAPAGVTFEDLLEPPPLTPEALAAVTAEVAQQAGADVTIVSEPHAGVSVREAVDAGLEVLRLHGFLPSIRAAKALVSRPQSGRVVVINPQSGLRDLHVYARRFARTVQEETDKLGGLITPR
ncbi:MAG TPA: hypothetical protein VFL57_19620 [Bryobacteraceae bacterium]|nr:hypothetical protein [Bryobacteraceae bacterium]